MHVATWNLRRVNHGMCGDRGRRAQKRSWLFAAPYPFVHLLMQLPRAWLRQAGQQDTVPLVDLQPIMDQVGLPAVRLMLQNTQPPPPDHTGLCRVRARCVLKSSEQEHWPLLVRSKTVMPAMATLSDYTSLKAQRCQETSLLNAFGHLVVRKNHTSAGMDLVSDDISRATLYKLLHVLQPGQKICLLDPTATEVETSEERPLPASASPNLSHVLAVVESPTAFFIFFPYEEYTLKDMLVFSPGLLFSRHTVPLFIVYQLLQALCFCHEQGLLHGNLRPQLVDIDPSFWVHLNGFTCNIPRPRPLVAQLCSAERYKEPLSLNLSQLVDGWTQGWLTNYEYLMTLNALAGRRIEDPNHHPVLPWVIDFSCRNGQPRNLSKTKYRLNKGDQQLDITFRTVVPHHISDILSEVTYYVYMSRRTPKEMLQRYVRGNWVPNEYPSSMQRMYEWTPDECIPAFYTDPNIFTSIHPDLPDLEIPVWASSPEQFIQWHMDALESDAVSESLHNWVDLTFGYKLAGRAAIEAKNVVLSLATQRDKLTNHGIIQLFDYPHPPRQIHHPAGKAGLGRSLASPAPLESYIIIDGPSTWAAVESTGGSKANLATSPSAGFPAAIEPHLRQHASSISLTLPTATPQRPRSVLADSDALSLALVAGDGAAVAALGDDAELDGRADWIAHSRDSGSGKTLRRRKGAVEVQSGVGTIPMPASFNPVQALEELERGYGFVQHSRAVPLAAPTVQQQCPADLPAPAPTASDMFSFGCLVSEIFMHDPVRLWCVRTLAGPDPVAQEHAIAQACRFSTHLLPVHVRCGVERLLDPVAANRPSANELLNASGPNVLFTFPEYFSRLYNFLREMKASDSAQRVQVAENWMPELLTYEMDGFMLCLPALVDLFKANATRLDALDVFDPIACRLGPQATRTLFHVPISFLFDAEDTELRVRVLNQKFLGRLIERFETQYFIEHYLGLVLRVGL